jgi:hypothetical protein
MKEARPEKRMACFAGDRVYLFCARRNDRDVLSVVMKRCSYLLFALVLGACHPEPPAGPSPEAVARGEMLKNLHGAATNLAYCQVLAMAPGATDLAKQDAKDADVRLSSLERRAAQMGLLGPEIDPELKAGDQEGTADGKKTLEERAARKAAEAKPQ